jgi:catechol 2,3-dioxygenase-like lactoylglutathione lyase family enzyme
MKAVIADMIDRFEGGRLSRRDLIQGLSALTATAAVGSVARAATPEALKATGIDHVSVLVKDLARSTAFYQSVFGFTVIGEDQEHRIVRLGSPGTGKRVLVSLRMEEPYGTIDHYCISLGSFDREAVTEKLKAFGLTPQQSVEFGFYVRDPDGAVVQMFGPVAGA